MFTDRLLNSDPLKSGLDNTSTYDLFSKYFSLIKALKISLTLKRKSLTFRGIILLATLAVLTPALEVFVNNLKDKCKERKCGVRRVNELLK